MAKQRDYQKIDGYLWPSDLADRRERVKPRLRSLSLESGWGLRCRPVGEQKGHIEMADTFGCLFVGFAPTILFAWRGE